MNEKQMKWHTLRARAVRAAVVVLAAFSILFTGTVPAGASSVGVPGVVVDVHFDFYCGDALFRAGEYNIEPGPVQNVISIRPMGRHDQRWISGIPERTTATKEGKPTLVFTRYPDGRNYLREIRSPQSSSHYFSKGRVEKESAAWQNRSAVTIPVIVAANRM